MTVEIICPFCGNVTKLDVDKDAYAAYRMSGLFGGSVQNAFPDLNDFERETLISRMCFDCQEKTFNRPQPGHEEAFGKRVGECEVCGCPIYEKDKVDDKYKCPQCSEIFETE